MATSIKEALRRWEEDKRIPFGRATEVNLSFCKPPIKELDNSLTLITSVEVLSLSTNCIEKITGLQHLKNLRILSLGRNNIKDLNGLEVLADSLEQLWISYNFIEKLRVIASLPKLRVLYIAHNQIEDWSEIDRLQKLANLESVLFIGNPFAESMDEEKYFSELSTRLPQVKTIDGETVIRVSLSN